MPDYAPQATDAEVASAARGFVTLCGRFVVDEAAGIVTHHAELDLVPHAVGRALRRHTVLSGDKLVLRPLPPYRRGIVGVSLSWQRETEWARPHPRGAAVDRSRTPPHTSGPGLTSPLTVGTNGHSRPNGTHI